MACRFTFSLILFTVLLILLPLTSVLIKEDLGYILALVWVALLGIAMAILMTSVFGLLGVLPGKYTGTAMTGLAFSGVFIGTFRIITLAIWSDEDRSETTELIGALIYFGVSALICVGALISFFVSCSYYSPLLTGLVHSKPPVHNLLHHQKKHAGSSRRKPSQPDLWVRDSAIRFHQTEIAVTTLLKLGQDKVAGYRCILQFLHHLPNVPWSDAWRQKSHYFWGLVHCVGSIRFQLGWSYWPLPVPIFHDSGVQDCLDWNLLKVSRNKGN